ncbi:hypothetical protein HOK00_09475 [bacterium]|nr:hypothetical protein [bacterium]
MFKYEIISKHFYFERELFLLKFTLNDQAKYAMFYKSSGLNGGTKNRILPFFLLQDTLPRFGEAKSGIVPGYIHKRYPTSLVKYTFEDREHLSVEKYYSKELDSFPKYTSMLLHQLTEELSNIIIPKEEQDINKILYIAEAINSDFLQHINNFNEDWLPFSNLNLLINNEPK